MASRKEYAMLFSLNAQMNSNFSGTFSKAQQQLISMQKELQNLSKKQGDISAYQKQQQAVESTQKKLETLQQQYDNIQKEIAETGTYSSDLENKLLAKQQQIDKTSASLDRQTQKLDQMGAALRDAGVDTGNLQKESERLSSEMADLKKKEEEAAEGADSFGKKTGDAFSAAQAAIAAAGIAVALKEIYEGYKECINVAGEFEASMSNVEALSGASTEELQQLAAMAKELGATTKFTAKESADAMGYMAMAGWDAQQMLSGMPGVLSLAAAAGEDLATVSDIVTDSMTAFGLSASETGRYADVLAATAANANTSVSVMGETFKYAAPVAGALGYSIEDVSTAIGLMANAGIKGSNAGTALRNVFNGLLAGVTLTGEAFGEAEVSAVRADGTMADFATTIDQLRGYFNQMTEAERVNNAMAIAGQRGYAGLLSILNASEADYAKLTEAINNSTGAAQHMADVKMDNMVGQLTLLNSAWEAVQTTVGENFTPMLSKLYGYAAKVLGAINDFLQKHPALIKGLTAAVAVIGLVVGGIAAYTAAAKLAAIASAALSAAIPGVNIIMGVAAGLAVLTGAIVALSSASKEAEDEAANLTATSREQYYQLQDLRKEYDAVCEAQGAYSADAQFLKKKLDDETKAFEDSKLTAEDAAKAHRDLMDAHKELMSSFADQTTEIDRNAESNLNLMNKLFELVDAEEQTAAQKQQILSLVELLNERLPDLALAYDENANALNMTKEAVEAVARAEYKRQQNASKHDALIKAISEENDLRDHQQEAIAEVEARQREYNEALAKEAEAKARVDAQYKDHTSDAYWRAVATAVSGYTTQVTQARAALDEAKAAEEEATAAFNENQAAISSLSGELATYTEEQAEVSRGSVEVAEAINSASEKVRILTEEYNKAYEAAYSSISGQYDLWDEAGAVAEKKTADISAALETQTKHWNDYNANLSALRDRAGDIEGLSDVIASFADGSDESVAAIAGMANASKEDLEKMVKQWKDLQEAQNATSGTIAEFKTDFTQQMDELTQELQNDIKALDMSGDAAESGRALIQAFIDKAAEMEPQVQYAYAKLGVIASSALGSASGNYGTVETYGWLGHHFASGTDSAPPGYALVGEEGPEIVLLHGGEKILNAEETKQLQREYVTLAPYLLDYMEAYAKGTDYAKAGRALVGENGPEAVLYPFPSAAYPEAEEAIPAVPTASEGERRYTITLAPVYNISGNMDREDLASELRSHDEELLQMLEDRLNELKTDRARRAYK